MLCVACDEPLTNKNTSVVSNVCTDCYVDPKHNTCSSCRNHFSGIPYAFVCGVCLVLDKMEEEES